MEGKKTLTANKIIFILSIFVLFSRGAFKLGLREEEEGILTRRQRSKTEVAFKSTSDDMTNTSFFCFSSTRYQSPPLISTFAQHACRHAPVPVVHGRGEYLRWQFEPLVERRLEFHETRGGSARGREHRKGQRFLLMGLANSRITENNLSPHDFILAPFFQTGIARGCRIRLRHG